MASVALLGKHPHSDVADDDRLTDHHIGHRHAGGSTGLDIDRDPTVHFLQVDRHPGFGDADFRSLIRRTVKALGKRAVHVGRDQPTVFGVNRDRSMISDLCQNPFELFTRTSRHLDAGIARIVTLLADVDLDNPKLSAASYHAVQNVRKQQAVNNVARDFDFFDNSVSRVVFHSDAFVE